MLAVGVEGDIGAPADIIFSLSIEAEAISLVLVLTVSRISDTALTIPVLAKNNLYFYLLPTNRTSPSIFLQLRINYQPCNTKF